MALFKIAKGTEANLTKNKPNTTEGYCYVTTDTKKFYVDTTTATGTSGRICLNAENADTVNGHTVAINVPANAKFTDTNTTDLPSMTGTLGVAHGGTGQTSLDDVTVGKAKALDCNNLIKTTITGSTTDWARLEFNTTYTTSTISNIRYLIGYLNSNSNQAFSIYESYNKLNDDSTTTSTYKRILDCWPEEEASFHGKADSATKLATSRIITANLSTSTQGKFDGSAAITISVTGVLPISKGGTGVTSSTAAANALINGLTTGTNAPVDNDYFISQFVSGNSATTTSGNKNNYYRRPMSALWAYTKGKMANDSGVNISGTSANVTGTVAVANGGTGATTADAARTNLGAAPAYVYSTTDLTAGTSTLTTGVLYFVYE